MKRIAIFADWESGKAGGVLPLAGRLRLRGVLEWNGRKNGHLLIFRKIGGPIL
jgi:hypothetical protein